MNKRFLVGALLVALSTAGYAYDEVKGTWLLGGMSGVNNNFTAVQNDVNNINNSLAGKVDKDDVYTKEEADNKFASKDDVANGIQSSIDAANGIINQVEQDLNNKINEKADANNVYNKEEVDQKVTDALQGALGYTDSAITEVENKLNGKADVDFVTGQVDQAYNDLAGKVDEKLKGKVDTEDFNRLDNEVGQITSDVAALQGDINNKVNKDEFEQATDNLQQQIDKNNHISQETDKQLNNKIDEETSKLNDKIDANKAEQADKDAAQDAEIAKGDRIDKVQNQQIGNLQSQNLAQDKNIQANKDAIAANKAEQDKVNAEQKENNEQQQAAIDKNTSDIKDHGNRLDTLENNFAQYDGRLSGLEKKVDHLDDKMNKGLSLMAAMNAVDFQNVQTGEMALGAGIGHYGNAQSVALGVAYAPVEDLTVNAKYSITAGDPDSFAVGAGATYKFKVGR